MPPQSRGSRRLGSHSLSTPNLPAIRSLTPIDTHLPPPTSITSQQQDQEQERAPHPHKTSLQGSRSSAEDRFSPDGNFESDSDTQSTSSFERGLLFPISSPSTTSSASSSIRGDDDVPDDPPPPHSRISERSSTSTGAARPLPTTGHSLAKRLAATSSRNNNGLYTLPSRSASSFLVAPLPAAFAPPFYNRPPTPLPPSPSLTSLLRPPFTTSATASTYTSRPATPTSEHPPSLLHARRTRTDESSDAEHHAASTTHSATASASLTRSAAAAPVHIPRASPKVPTYEYYGFVLYLSSSFFFFMYLLWSFLPTPFLHHLGLYYYPDRWWSLAVPAWIVILLVYIYVALGSYNVGVLTRAVGEVECIVDNVAVVAGADGIGRRRPADPAPRSGGAHRGRHGEPQHRGKRVGCDDSRVRRSGRAKKKHKSKKPASSLASSTVTSPAKSPSANAPGSGSYFPPFPPPSPASPHKDKGHNTQGVPQVKPETDVQVDWRDLWNRGTDAVMDVPIGGVCEILYGEGRDSAGEDGDDEDAIDLTGTVVVEGRA